MLRIGSGSNTDTSLQDALGDTPQRIYTSNGCLYIESETSKQLPVYNLSTGGIVRNITIHKGVTVVSDLDKGVYVVAGQKIIL